MDADYIREWLEKSSDALAANDSEKALGIAAKLDKKKREHLESDESLQFDLFDVLSRVIKDEHLE